MRFSTVHSAYSAGHPQPFPLSHSPTHILDSSHPQVWKHQFLRQTGEVHHPSTSAPAHVCMNGFLAKQLWSMKYNKSNLVKLAYGDEGAGSSRMGDDNSMKSQQKHRVFKCSYYSNWSCRQLRFRRQCKNLVFSEALQLCSLATKGLDSCFVPFRICFGPSVLPGKCHANLRHLQLPPD